MPHSMISMYTCRKCRMLVVDRDVLIETNTQFVDAEVCRCLGALSIATPINVG